ncbi:hypothetical protein GCM10020000_21810 [Streptomyces olivoverticillatus]
MEAVGGRIGDGHVADDAGALPAARAQPDLLARRHARRRRHRQRRHDKPFGAHQCQVAFGQHNHVVSTDDAGELAGSVQDEPRKPVDRLMARDQSAAVVDEEARAPRATGEVTDAHQRLVSVGPPTVHPSNLPAVFVHTTVGRG